jgi:hypothetical protein
MRATTTGLRTKALLVFQSGALVEACGGGTIERKVEQNPHKQQIAHDKWISMRCQPNETRRGFQVEGFIVIVKQK